jgi:murein DD-endopeptidase MepM/ murein hydrolase activator NlpD
MRMTRSCLSSFSGIRSLISPTDNIGYNKTQSILTRAFVAVAVGASLFSPLTLSAAQASGTAKPAQKMAATPFLTLPFVPNSRMSVLSGWYYSGGGGFHGGIDYINGGVNDIGGWRTFPVIASADGEACGNCTSRQGNAVWIKHDVDGVAYYTYYGHLASIAKGIPLGSQSNTVPVKRGQIVGMAGSTGAAGILHLHYGLYNAASQPIDPYSIGKLREYYPRPTTPNPGVGWFVK